MSGYVDLAAEAKVRHEEAAYQRRRLLAAFRGWIRENGSPRRVAAGAFAVAAVVAIAIARACVVIGLAGPPLASAIAVIAAWPVFLLILWKYAAAKWDVMAEDPDICRFIAADRASLVAENSPQASKWEGAWNAAARGTSRVVGGTTGVFGVILLTVATAGIWLVYTLIDSAPELVAEITLDGVIAVRQPTLVRKVETFPWPRYAAELTFPYFFGIAVAAWIETGIISLMLT